MRDDDDPFSLWDIPGRKSLVHDGKRLLLKSRLGRRVVRMAVSLTLSDGQPYAYTLPPGRRTNERAAATFDLAEAIAGVPDGRVAGTITRPMLVHMRTLHALDAKRAGVSPEHPLARVEAASQASEPMPASSPPGPVMAWTAVAPVLPVSQPASRLLLVRPSVDRWSTLIDEAAQRFGIPAEWVRGVMQQESAGRTHQNGYPIVSSAGAIGLMQVMPATFAELRARYRLGPDPHDPRTNIMAGAAYLREMYDRYGPRYFLAAYNAGPARVDDNLRTGRALPYETRAYTASLMPALVPNAIALSATTSTGVQDLTSVETLRAAASASSRSVRRRPASPSAASIFVRTAGSGSAAASHDAEQVRDGLFVTSSAADRRQSAQADGTAGS